MKYRKDYSELINIFNEDTIKERKAMLLQCSRNFIKAHNFNKYVYINENIIDEIIKYWRGRRGTLIILLYNH